LNFPFVPSEILDFFLKFGYLSVELLYVPFEDFLFRLHKLGFLLFVLDISLYLLTKLDLNNSYSFLILGLHLRDDLFIHLDHLGE
jgi:hypothetical protein